MEAGRIQKTAGSGRKRRMLPVTVAVMVIIAALLGAGCTRRTGTDNTPTETDGTAGTENTETEPSGKGPETSEPSTIESFPVPTTEPATEPEPPKETEPEFNWEKTAIVATDIHYLARSLTDGGSSFQYMVEHGDGKVVTYIEQIVDAFLEEVIAQKPDMLILSGDLTLDGEKKSHEELAGKLYSVQNAGIPVLVIPGNHDINNHHAAEYPGE